MQFLSIFTGPRYTFPVFFLYFYHQKIDLIKIYRLIHISAWIRMISREKIYHSLSKRVITWGFRQYSLDQGVPSHFFFYIFSDQTIDLIKIHRLIHNSAWIRVFGRKTILPFYVQKGYKMKFLSIFTGPRYTLPLFFLYIFSSNDRSHQNR